LSGLLWLAVGWFRGFRPLYRAKQSELSAVHQSSMTPHDENSLASRLPYRSQRSFQFAIQVRSHTLLFPPRLTVRQRSILNEPTFVLRCHNVQANQPKTIPEPLQKKMDLKIPQTFKEANGFGSGLAPCYGLAVGYFRGSRPLYRAEQSELSDVHQPSMTPHDENSLASRLPYRSQRSFRFAI